MSHNVVLSGVKFGDLAVLKQAFGELQRDQIEAKNYQFVDTPTVVRGWYGRQTKVDAAIICPGQEYDIGFMRNAEGELVPMMESGFCAPGVSTQPGAKTVEDKVCPYDHQTRALGMLQQRYALINTENNARRMGSLCSRVAAADGQIQLHVTAR